MNLINEIQYIDLQNGDILMVNLINGAADLINNKIKESLTTNDFDSLDKDIINQLLNRRYAFESIEDEKNFKNSLEETINESEKNSAPNFLLIPTYNCNLSCTYCYEKGYDILNQNVENLENIIDEQFKFIKSKVEEFKGNCKRKFSNKDVKITLMGGEPLMNANKKYILYILNQIRKNNYSFNVVTNGVDLEHFIKYLKEFNVDHIQITLDGPKSIHDKRRIFKNGIGSFDKIFNNIQLALESNIKVIVRTNVDSENLEFLPNLSEILYDNFNKYKLFSAYAYVLQDGGCIGTKNILSENIAIEKIYEMERKNPKMKVLNKRFHGFKFVNSIINDEKFYPSLRHCAAATNQYILDYKGDIYKCWHGIGDEKNKIGKFTPKINVELFKESDWKERKVTKLQKCITCKYKYICGTGCPGTKTENGLLEVNKAFCVDFECIFEKLFENELI